ncbi:probable inactive receptor kinase At2g26730 [Vigna unguiculata]|uniref:probable inactive receptor kinase At2g26730 n=1 Tax=Vigna unguiculata TaxID=3917 RepID=UPI001015D05B|nr:probable inactive receptor kinase At2g26730 [Vigna unguiculata]
MSVKPIWVFFNSIFLFLLLANSEEEDTIKALVTFMDKLAPGYVKDPSWGWNLSSDPCIDKWHGVKCHSDNKYVMSVILENFNFGGGLDAGSICIAKSLQILSIKDNNLRDSIPEDIGNCKSLTHLFLSGNQFSGDLPISIVNLRNLIRLHISDNHLTGELPNMVHVSSLKSFVAQNNNFTGEIPRFDFSNLEEFNVSNNNLHGSVPDVRGYLVLGLITLIFLTYKLLCKLKTKEKELDVEKKEKAEESVGVVGMASEISHSNGSKKGVGIRSEYSLTSLESGMTTSGLVLLSSRTLRGLQFEDLLGAPAELIRRGKHGSLYKVMLDNGVQLAVKRIKDWGISKQDFQTRMNMIAQAKHPRVLPPVAYYCSQQEKLLAYQYMQNGSLFMLLYAGSESGQSFDWGRRLNVAAKIVEALTYMHEEFLENGIAHGNLKSNNILFDKNMDPCISEYGLMMAENYDEFVISHNKGLKSKDLIAARFKADVYALGMILLELLTGKVIKNDGFDLVKWVNTVVREEWTVEVFDKSLVLQGASEERMMNLLQVALKCLNPSPNDRPSMSQVAVMTNALVEEEEKSISFDT